MSVVKTIEVDPRVPGIRGEIPFPQAKQCSPELDFPSCQFSYLFSQKLQRLQEKPIVTSVRSIEIEVFQQMCFFFICALHNMLFKK